MAVSSNSSDLQSTDKQSKQRESHQASLSDSVQHPCSFDWIKECLHGILVFTEEKDLVYASDDAYQILSRLNEPSESPPAIPEEILHICQALIQSRCRFPHQNWLMEFDIVTQDAAILHIRSRWFKGDKLEHPYLILLLEDRQQAITHILFEEAKTYGLTPREKQVWMLHRNAFTYKQIAKKLGITPNTVKKHMRSIHAKQKKSSSSCES